MSLIFYYFSPYIDDDITNKTKIKKIIYFSFKYQRLMNLEVNNYIDPLIN